MAASTSEPEQDQPAPAHAVEPERIVQLLSQGRLELVGQVLSSNYVFLASVDDGDLRTLAVYKPQRGESPLWDFPPGTLSVREVCAYLLSQLLGWPHVPPVVLRDGPFGAGTLQLYIDADPEVHYFVLRDERHLDLRDVALFDLLTNNADRKGGHLLLDRRGRVWAIDNALTFHAEPKLRTVIWDYAGEPIPAGLLDDLDALQTQLAGRGALAELLAKLLEPEQVGALSARLAGLLRDRAFALPDPTIRQVPWPLL
jgi:hypothetical protein